MTAHAEGRALCRGFQRRNSAALRGRRRAVPGTGAEVGAARRRKLHVGHFAFMRSVVQGMAPRESRERYLQIEGDATDQRTVRGTIA